IAARGGGARIYDRNGTMLYEFLDPDTGYQTPVKLEDVSPFIQQATIAAEDASFYDNPGVNVKGLTRAALENLKPGDSFLHGAGGVPGGPPAVTERLRPLRAYGCGVGATAPGAGPDGGARRHQPGHGELGEARGDRIAPEGAALSGTALRELRR